MRLVLSALAASALAASASAQTVYYVDALLGADSNPGLSYQQPKKTIQAAVDAARNNATPFDTVNVLPGIYQENVYIDFDVRVEGRPGAEVDPQGGTAFTIDSEFRPITAYTQIKNLKLRSTGGHGVDLAGKLENSARIENNEIADLDIGIDVSLRGGDEVVHAPLIRYNWIHATGENPAPFDIGVSLAALEEATLAAVVHANRISDFEWGIRCYGQTDNCRPYLRCDFIWRCEWGIYVEDGVDAHVTHESVAYGLPASWVSPVRGIEIVNSSTVRLANSLIWIPDGPLDASGTPVYLGDDLTPTPVLGATSGFLLESTIVEDCDPGAICIPDPQFASVAVGNLRLQPTSPAIDLANTLYVWPAPTGVDPIDHDLFGGPRILDPFRTGDLRADCGAHEYTEVDLDLVASGMGSGEPMVDTQIGATLSFTLRGLPNDAGFFWFAPEAYEMNFVVNPQGNQLVYPLGGVVPVTMTNDASGTFSTGGLSLWIPTNDPSLIEKELSFQAACIGGSGPITLATGTPVYESGVLGNMTRRIEVEVNDAP
jgi:hypothetical protein